MAGHQSINVLREKMGPARTAKAKAGAKLNVAAKNGETPLIAAAKDLSPEVIATIVNAGADINVKDNRGLTAIMIAAKNENLEIIEILDNAGADVNEA